METYRKSNEKYNLQSDKYENGQLAVFLIDASGSPLAELSVSQNSIQLKKDEFILKDYSENSELIIQVLNSGLIIPTERFVIIGGHLCSICKIKS